jgi:hypothetical protein
VGILAEQLEREKDKNEDRINQAHCASPQSGTGYSSKTRTDETISQPYSPNLSNSLEIS